MADTHVLVGTTATIEARFYADSVLADDLPVTVGITKADGTTLVASGTATTSGGVGIRRYALAAQAELNVLKATWTGATQTVVTSAKIVGAHLFTLADAKAFDGGAIVATTNAPVPSDQQILDTRARITDDFAEILGFQPVPRFRRATIDGDGLWSVLLPDLKCHRLLSVAVNGVAQQVGSYTLRRSGVLEATSAYVASGTFTAGRQNVAVEYVAGDERVDPATARAALIVAKSQLIRSDVTDRATSLAGPEGGTTFLSTPGRETGGFVQWYGLPQVDSVLNRRTQRGGVPV